MAGILSRIFGVSANSGFEAARHDRRLKGFVPARDHVNRMIAEAGPTLVARARHLVRNNGYAFNAVDAWGSHAVGVGIKPNPSDAIEANVRDPLLRTFRIWTDQADAEGRTDFFGLQRRVAEEVFIAGEAFVRFRSRRITDGLIVPLQLHVLPAEMLDVAYSTQLPSGNTIINGIEFDRIGRRVAYHFWRNHPGDVPSNGSMPGERSRVSATDVVHVYKPTEAGQVRGVSRFAPALIKLFSLDGYDDAEIERKKMAAMFGAFVRRGEGDPFADGDDGEEPGLLAPMEPGLIQYLEDGEDITFAQPVDVGGSYEVFQYRTLLQISAALGVPYPYLTGDMQKANYSNTRASIVDFRRRVEAFQWSIMVFGFCRPVWERWLDEATVSRTVSLPDFGERRREYAYAEWLPPKWDWVDPKKDAEAEIIQIAAGLKSRTQALSERGYDPEQVDGEIAADRERERRLGLSFASKTSASTRRGQQDQSEEAE